MGKLRLKSKGKKVKKKDGKQHEQKKLSELYDKNNVSIGNLKTKSLILAT